MHLARLQAGINFMTNYETIAAIATPPGHGGIGIIRISGPTAGSVARRLFRPRPAVPSGAEPPPGRFITPYRLNYGFAIDPGTGRPVDEAFMVYMPAPHSYTREDVVELQIHGGPVVLEMLLHLILAQGVRLAEPGEFTRRAFLNGRIDLTQAEAVADLIQAKNQAALNVAVSHLGGALKDLIEPLIDQLTQIRADLEAGIEFADDTGLELDRDALRQQVGNEILPRLQDLADSYQHGHMLREGLRLAIVGRPNVGKSSLLNALTLQERAIVTEIPGTTRDTIEAPFFIRGLPILAVDTAGLRPSNDPVERIGIQRARDALATADLVLFLIEACTPFGPADQSILDETRHKAHLVVINKIDLMDRPEDLPLPPTIAPTTLVRISALTGEGLADLREIIAAHVTAHANKTAPNRIVTNHRHKACLDQALEFLRQAVSPERDAIPDDLISMDLSQAIDALNRLVGRSLDDDLLDTIFQRFCIGK